MSRRASRLASLPMLGVLLAAPSVARAQAEPDPEPEPSPVAAAPPAPPPAPAIAHAYALSLDTDGPILLISGALAAGFFVTPELSGVRCAPQCEPSKINAIDRPAAGLYSTAWGTVGDVATATTILIAPAVVIASEGLSSGLKDSLVILEAVAGASALQVVTGFAVQRPRPRVYGTDAPEIDRTDANAARSFFSGHTADTMASVVAGARTFQRLGRPGMAWAVLMAGGAGTALVATSRVLAGAHFPTDVVAGAAVGTGFGLLMPALHGTAMRVTASAPGATAGMSLMGTF